MEVEEVIRLLNEDFVGEIEATLIYVRKRNGTEKSSG